MDLHFTITLTAEQILEIGEAMRKACDPIKRHKPYTFAEFSAATGVPQSTFRDMIKVGRIRKVPILGRTLIPAMELETFL
jgi:hypothetical protein